VDTHGWWTKSFAKGRFRFMVHWGLSKVLFFIFIKMFLFKIRNQFFIITKQNYAYSIEEVEKQW